MQATCPENGAATVDSNTVPWSLMIFHGTHHFHLLLPGYVQTSLLSSLLAARKHNEETEAGKNQRLDKLLVCAHPNQLFICLSLKTISTTCQLLIIYCCCYLNSQCRIGFFMEIIYLHGTIS